MPLPTSQPNWSPNMGLNLLKSLPRLSNGALPVLNPPMSGQLGVPEPGFLAEESRGLASVMAFGSIPIQNQLFRPFSPHLGSPNPLSSHPTALASTSSGHGTDVHKDQQPYHGTVRQSVSPQTSIRSGIDAKSPMGPNRSVDIAGSITEGNQGSVWVPDKRVGPSGRGPVLTYKHDTSHPPWSSGADYDDIVNWRIPRVISHDGIAVKFNMLCITARDLNGLNHQSDPLPWCRDGSDPVREAAISAEYNLYALQANERGSSQGDDECLRHLLAGPDEPKVTPGRSVERLLSAGTFGFGHMSPSNFGSIPTTPTNSAGLSNANKLIRKESPVMRRADQLDLPLTRTRLNENPFFPLGNNEDLDELDELEEVNDIPSSVLNSKSASVPVAKAIAKTGSSASTRGRKSGSRLKTVSLSTSDSVIKNKPTGLAPAQKDSTNHEESSDTEDNVQVTPGSSPPRKSKVKKNASSPIRFQWSAQPNELDYMFLTHLAQFEPFAVAKEQVERFHQCALHLKNHPDTQPKFKLMSANRQTHTLRNRFKQLKVWLRSAEAASQRASGSQEVDEKLREMLKEFIHQEEQLDKSTAEAKEAKEAAVNSVGRAQDLRNEFASRRRSGPTPAGMTEEEAQLDDDVEPRPANSLRSLRHQLNNKFDDRGNTGAHIVEVTMKGSQAQERANEIAMLAIERHQQQTTVTNLQRERELAQSQARLDLDSRLGQDTLALRRDELAAATTRKEKTEEHIDELKSSMSNVQGTLSEMGSVLNLLVERIPATKPS